MHFIVKLFPEITIKSPPVRKRMIKQLRDNLRKLLHELNPAVTVERDWEKIEVSGPENVQGLEQKVIQVLARTPGIANFARVSKFPLGTFDDMVENTLCVWGERLKGRTFCVRAKRSGSHPFRSVDVERRVGGGLLHRSEAAGVRLQNPDVTVRLEIRGDELFVLEEKWPGLGGFPLGSQDPVLSLISGGFDSTIASFMAMKRGVRTHFCFFNLGGRAHEVGVKEVAFFLWNRYGASHRVRFVTIPFEEVVAEILTRVDNAYMGVVLKRMMLRAATRVAAEMSVQALVTGESVAQVSSQTLPNLAVIDSATDMLTLRPLALMDKSEIIDIARRIGTEDFAANMPEYCGVISVKPTTRAKPERVEYAESRFDFEILDRAFANRRVENIDQVMEESGEAEGVDIFATPQPGATILDIRHPDEVEQRPLAAGSTDIVTMPFFNLHTQFEHLDQQRQYLFYCEKGVMSRLHAELLREQGFKNVAVYRPIR